MKKTRLTVLVTQERIQLRTGQVVKQETRNKKRGERREKDN